MPRLNAQRTRIQDDLRGLVDGDVRSDDVFCHMYASDAGVFEQMPLAVVGPRSEADIAACLAYATENGLCVHPRGAGSQAAGGALGSGVVLDLSRHMHHLLDATEHSVRAEAGIVVHRLNEILRETVRREAPPIRNAEVSTLGGAVAVDGWGPCAIGDGRPSDYVLALRAVLPNGSVVEWRRSHETTRRVSGSPAAHPLTRGPSISRDPAVRSLETSLHGIAKKLRDPVAGAGARLLNGLTASEVDPCLLLAGSEGTLGVITELEIATYRPKRHHSAVILYFDRLESALRAATLVLEHPAAGCFLADRRRLSLMRSERDERTRLAPASAEAVLVVQLADEDGFQLRDQVEAISVRLCEELKLAFGRRLLSGEGAMDMLRAWRRDADRCCSRLRGRSLLLPLADDVRVPTLALPDFVRETQDQLKRFKAVASIAGQLEIGQLQIYPLLDISGGDLPSRAAQVARALHETAVRHGGSFGDIRGIGYQRAGLFAQLFAREHALASQVKTLFDPERVLNPGKVVSLGQSDLNPRWRTTLVSSVFLPENSEKDAHIVDDAATETAPPQSEASNGDGPPAEDGLSPQEMLVRQLNWNPAPLRDTATGCDGCGDCRRRTPDLRMCPVFRTHPVEEAAPRSKASLLQGILSGGLELDALTSNELREVFDLCVQCHLCRVETPCRLDIANLTARFKGAHVAAHGLAHGDRVLARFDQFVRILPFMTDIANWSIGSPRMRWLMEKMFGIAQGRKLPRVARFTYLSRTMARMAAGAGPFARREGRGELKVALFVDTYANYFDVRLVDQLVAILRHNGVHVFVPPGQKSSGSQAVIYGDLARAGKLMRHNTSLLADAVRQGYKVVTLEPSTAVCLRFEYPKLLAFEGAGAHGRIEEDEVRLVADNTVDACTYLWNLHMEGKLRLDLQPIDLNIGYHEPCRGIAFRGDDSCAGGRGVSPAESLLRLIPGMNVHRLEAGCCGMAGLIGLRKKDYRNSIRGGHVLMRRLRSTALHIGSTECSACKIQMEQGAPKPTVHPIKLLALAYELVRNDGRLFRMPRNPLIVS